MKSMRFSIPGLNVQDLKGCRGHLRRFSGRNWNSRRNPGTEEKRMKGIGTAAIDENLAWYALHVKAGFEKLVSLKLQSKRYEEFLPLYRPRSSGVGRLKEPEHPLFPGYLFCKFNAAQWFPILAVPGVNAIAGIGQGPAAIVEREINDVRAILKSGAQYEPWPFLGIGQIVRVQFGSLMGTQGIVVIERNIFRLVTSVSLL